MEPFIILFVYLILLLLVTKHMHYKHKRMVQSVGSLLGLLFLLGLHSPDVGADMEHYIPAFQGVSKELTFTPDFVLGFEPGFVLYMSAIKLISSNEQIFLFISALVILIPIVLMIFRHSEMPMLSIIIYASWYLYYFSFSGLRQALAISICVIASMYMMRRKWLPFILIVLLASQFHASALLFLIAYPLYNIHISNVKLFLASVIMLLVLIVFKDVLSLVADFVFGEGNRYTGHIKTGEFGGYTIAIVYLLIAIVQITANTRNKHLDNPYIPFLLVLMLFQFTGIYSQTIPRMGYYFLPFFALSFPVMIKQLPKKNRMIVELSLVVLFVSFFFMQASTHYLNVTPFKFYWEG